MLFFAVFSFFNINTLQLPKLMKNAFTIAFLCLFGFSAFSQTGRVGVGTTSPSAKLHVSDAASATIQAQDTRKSGERGPSISFREGLNTLEAILKFTVGGAGVRAEAMEYATSTTGRHNFSTGNVSDPDLTIIASGQVGVGEDSPAGKLHISGAGGAFEPQLIIQDSDDATAMMKQTFAVLRTDATTLATTTAIGGGINGVAAFDITVELDGGVRGSFGLNSSLDANPAYHLVGFSDGLNGYGVQISPINSDLVSANFLNIGHDLALDFSINASGDLEVVKSGGVYAGNINIGVLQKKIDF